MNTTKLNKWGNSQGVIIPKHLCEHVGMRIGDRVRLAVDASTGSIEITLVDAASDGKTGAVVRCG